MSLSVIPAEKGKMGLKVFVGTEPRSVITSINGGETWHKMVGLNKLKSSASWPFPPRPWTHNVRWIEPDKNNPVCILFATSLDNCEHGIALQVLVTYLFYLLVPFFLCLILFTLIFTYTSSYAIFDHLFIELGLGLFAKKYLLLAL